MYAARICRIAQGYSPATWDPMKQTLQFRLSQHLALTPQLQQSIRLLQLSTLELNQEIEQALTDNPLLERVDDPMDGALRILPNGGLETPRSSESTREDSFDGKSSGDEPRAADEFSGADSERDHDGLDWESGSGSMDGYSDSSGRKRGDEDSEESSYLQVASVGISLREHLSSQLRSLNCSPRDRGLVTLLIDEVNADGYLQLEIEDLRGIVPAELEIEDSELNTALHLLQSFDPIGVGARNVAECLQLQLSAPRMQLEYPSKLLELTKQLVRDLLPLLAARDFIKLKRVLRCDDDTLRAAQQLIKSLNPRPGAQFSSEESNYVIPDVIVKKTRQGWKAVLNADVMPKLRINDMYAQILKRNRGANGALGGQLQEARWLLKNVQQRFDTILRVAQAIVERQRSFFSHGAVAMRPLVLREIADAVGLHESTVSRVTTQKFMLTPYGTLELKYFFGSHVSTESGGEASSTAIRELIKQLIASEDTKTPLSDNRIAVMLGEQGIMVARRTVAKYREALKISPVAQRKAL